MVNFNYKINYINVRNNIVRNRKFLLNFLRMVVYFLSKHYYLEQVIYFFLI